MRACGVLLPVSSLPSPYGIGCFSKEAYEFVDQLVQAGQLIAVPSGDGEREVAFAPAHDTGTLTVYGVLEAVEASGQTTVDLARNAELTRIDRELENLKETARKSQDNVRLVDLL